MQNTLAPITENERIISLDVMRGFAIFGIYLINMIAFHSPFLHIDPLTWWDSTLDRNVYILIDIFAQASFYPLFSMLFGYGLVILRERTIQKGYNFSKIALRRLATLLVIGMIHAFLIWEGDILILYAVFGFLSLIFLRMTGKKLLLTGLLFYSIANLLLSFMLFVMYKVNPNESFDITDVKAAEISTTVYQSGTFSEITQQRIQDWSEVYNLFSFPIFLFDILPLFLIGAGVAKLGWLKEVQIHKNKLKRTLWLLFPIGVLLKTVPYLQERNYFNDYVQDIFGGPMLAISYACAIALLMEKNTARKILLYLAPIGKLSMSNYLFQSVLTTMIFYSYGLGLYGKISLAGGTLLAIVIFTFQIFISHWWVKRYYYGPVEWLWRSVTYWKIPKWSRK